MASTRLSSELFLIGMRDLEQLDKYNQLPTVRQVLQRFHHFLKETKSVRNSSHLTVEELLIVWSRSAIPTTLKKHAVEKLEKYHSEWLLLKKNMSRQSDKQLQRETEFTNTLDSLFDIAHASASSQIKLEEDRRFLSDQREERKMIMTTEDKELTKKMKRAAVRRQRQESHKEKYAAATSSSSTCKYVMTESDTSDNTDSDSDNADEFRPIIAKRLRKQEHSTVQSSNFFTNDVTGALDRNKTSDREAVRLMIPIAAALGHDPSQLPFSRSTIRRMRSKSRKECAQSTQAEFTPSYAVVVHWDGKILPDILGHEKVSCWLVSSLVLYPH